MVETEIHIDAPPDEVFAVLADPHTYPDWLVGAHEIRSVEGEWPAPGATFHHRVGVWPVHIADSTSILEVDPPRRLVLRARARPTGVARVEFDLGVDGTGESGGTRVRLREAPSSGPAHLLWLFGARSLMERGLRARNERSLEQLRACVETTRQAASTRRGRG